MFRVNTSGPLCLRPFLAAGLAGAPLGLRIQLPPEFHAQGVLILSVFLSLSDCPQVHAPVGAFRVQLVEDSADLHPLRFFEFLDARGQWDDFSYRKCLG